MSDDDEEKTLAGALNLIAKEIKKSAEPTAHDNAEDALWRQFVDMRQVIPGQQPAMPQAPGPAVGLP